MCVLENQETSCPNCGFDKNNYPVDKKKLRVDFILKGQYLVGNSLNSTPYENTYIGWNLNQDSRVVVKEFLPSGLAVREDYSTGNVMAASDESVAGFKMAIDDYVGKAETIMSEGGKVEISDVFRENGTAYYIMPAEGEDEHYRLMAFTYVDGQTIDKMVEQARPRKPERVFVQPARSAGRGMNYGSTTTTIPSQPVYVPEPEPYIPRGNISAHVIPDNRIEYKPEVVLPSLHESNREAQEREREKELERKIEKRIEERLEKQLEERIEKQIVRTNGVFSINPDLARQNSGAAPQQSSTVDRGVVERNETASVGTKEGNPGTIQGDRRSPYTSIPPVSNGVNVNQTSTSNQYRGVINVNGRMVDPTQARTGKEESETKRSDKTKLSEIKIAGKSLSAVASIAICAVIIVLVITTLISKNGDEKTSAKDGSVNANNTSAPNGGSEVDKIPVEFSSWEFEQAVRQALGLADDEIITASYIEGVTNLDLSGAGLEDISDISKFTGLKVLNLSKNKPVDINALAQLTELTSVDLGNCKLSDISVLSGLSNLEYVNLLGNSIAMEDYSMVDNVLY